MKERHVWGISGGGVSVIGATHISLAYDTLLWLGFLGRYHLFLPFLLFA